MNFDSWQEPIRLNRGGQFGIPPKISTRMPVILPEDQLDAWLFGEAGKDILVPYPADEMAVWPISPQVNSPKNNDADIMEPIAVEAQARRPATG